MKENSDDDSDRDVDAGDDHTDQGGGSSLIPDADAGETDADSVSRDEGNKGHEEYKNP